MQVVCKTGVSSVCLKYTSITMEEQILPSHCNVNSELSVFMISWVSNINFSGKFSSLIQSNFRNSVYWKAICMAHVRNVYLISLGQNSLQKDTCSSLAVQNNAQTLQTKPIFSASRFRPFRKCIYHDNRFFCV